MPPERIPIEWIGIRSTSLASAHVCRKTGIHFSGTCAKRRRFAREPNGHPLEYLAKIPAWPRLRIGSGKQEFGRS
jgi:hypothetical protein